jgi:hypothetical protein
MYAEAVIQLYINFLELGRIALGFQLLKSFGVRFPVNALDVGES